MRRARLLLCGLALLPSCSKGEPKKPRTEPWENPAYQTSAKATGSARPAPGSITRYRLNASRTRVSFTLPAKLRTPRGTLGIAGGELEFRAPTYANLQGKITFDLTKLIIEGDAGDDDPERTTRARHWLEVDAAGDRYRSAVFELSSFEVEPGSEKSYPPREPRSGTTILGTARGRLSLHGFRAPLQAAVSVETQSNGLAMTVRSRRPVSIKLEEHDVKPRNARGETVASDLKLLGSEIGREAGLEFELTFEKVP